MSAGEGLFYLSLNPSSSQTVVLLHGLFSNHLEYANVIPFLSNYHILAVDLPAHSGSSNIRPFSLATAAEQVATLIRHQAHDSRAHVVGLSAGGFVGLNLAKEHPDLVESLWVTGAAPFDGLTKWLAQRPGILYFFIAAFLKYCPDWLYWKFCEWNSMKKHQELREDIKKNFTMDLVAQAYGDLDKFGDKDIGLVTARTLTIAGSLLDNVEGTRKMGKTLRGKNGESKAALVKGAVHSWNLQFPELFAKGILAWISKTDLPEEFEELS